MIIIFRPNFLFFSTIAIIFVAKKNRTMNPFITRGYAGPEYFCDREQETRDIIKLLTNGNNIALISPRRLGKTI